MLYKYKQNFKSARKSLLAMWCYHKGDRFIRVICSIAIIIRASYLILLVSLKGTKET